MIIKVYKTYEISDDLWSKIVVGFRESYNLDTSVEIMKNAFCVQNKLGYGYHAIGMTEDGEVAGYNVFSPTFYKNGIKVVVSGSTYVRPKYKKDSMFLFLGMMKELRKAVIEDGFQVEVGVPNHNSRAFAAKVMRLTYIGDLKYYILPTKFSRCINMKKLRFFDPIFFFLIDCHLWIQSKLLKLYNPKEKLVKYEMLSDNESLEARFNGPYKHISDGNYQAYYREYNEDGRRAVYLMDFREKGERTSRSLNFSVRKIMKAENPDAILFVGLLRISQCSLFRVPKGMEPKTLPLTYYLLNREDENKFADMKDINNWNFSLMNFDVR